MGKRKGSGARVIVSPEMTKLIKKDIDKLIKKSTDEKITKELEDYKKQLTDAYKNLKAGKITNKRFQKIYHFCSMGVSKIRFFLSTEEPTLIPSRGGKMKEIFTTGKQDKERLEAYKTVIKKPAPSIAADLGKKKRKLKKARGIVVLLGLKDEKGDVYYEIPESFAPVSLKNRLIVAKKGKVDYKEVKKKLKALGIKFYSCGPSTSPLLKPRGHPQIRINYYAHY